MASRSSSFPGPAAAHPTTQIDGFTAAGAFSPSALARNALNRVFGSGDAGAGAVITDDGDLIYRAGPPLLEVFTIFLGLFLGALAGALFSWLQQSGRVAPGGRICLFPVNARPAGYL